MGENIEPFKLLITGSFDARGGYTRWILPGLGARSTKRGSLVEADLWTDRQGILVTRFTSPSRGCSEHFKIQGLTGEEITPDQQEAVADFLVEKLLEWAFYDFEGVDIAEYDEDD